MSRATVIDGHKVYIGDQRLIGDYVVRYEDFSDEVTSATDLGTMGWVATDIGTSSFATTVEHANNYLLLDCGATADKGVELQLLTDTTATHTNRPHKSIGPMTSTATLMDNREMFFFTRVGFAGIDAAWTSKFLIGWCVTDTSLLSPTTGATSITTGGGLFFHYGETADVQFGAQRKDASASTTSVGTALGGDSFADTSVIGQWIELGFHAVWSDASDDADNGTVNAYVNGALVATDDNNLPMASTQTYGLSIAAINSPATSNQLDVGVDYVIHGISRPGITTT